MKTVPDRLSISIGGHFGTSFGVESDGSGAVTYSRTKRRDKDPWEIGSSEEWETESKQITPTQERWATFRAELDRLNVWSWQADYPNPGVCDGTSWGVEIVYADKAIVSGGSNCFPGGGGRAIAITELSEDETFAKFCRAVSALVGRKFR